MSPRAGVGGLPVPTRWFLHGRGPLVGPASPSPCPRKSLGLLSLRDTHADGRFCSGTPPPSFSRFLPTRCGGLDLSSTSVEALATMRNRILSVSLVGCPPLPSPSGSFLICFVLPLDSQRPLPSFPNGWLLHPGPSVWKLSPGTGWAARELASLSLVSVLKTGFVYLVYFWDFQVCGTSHVAPVTSSLPEAEAPKRSVYGCILGAEKKSLDDAKPSPGGSKSLPPVAVTFAGGRSV